MPHIFSGKAKVAIFTTNVFSEKSSFHTQYAFAKEVKIDHQFAFPSFS